MQHLLREPEKEMVSLDTWSDSQPVIYTAVDWNTWASSSKGDLRPKTPNDLTALNSTVSNSYL